MADCGPALAAISPWSPVGERPRGGCEAGSWSGGQIGLWCDSFLQV